MATANLSRGLAILEELVGRSDGLSLGEVAARLDLPKSAAHRLLTDLCEAGWVSQRHSGDPYALTLKMVSMGLQHLRDIPLVELAVPTLQRLAEESSELARLSIIEDDTLVWVAKRQGAQAGLRYDPDSGREAVLATTASGMAWLSTLDDDAALVKIDAQCDRLGLVHPEKASVRAELRRVRETGYAWADSTFEIGLAGIAVPITTAGAEAIGVLSVAGPAVRWTFDRATSIVPLLTEHARMIASIARTGFADRAPFWA